MITKTIGFIGTGNMAQALIKAINGNVTKIISSDVDEKKLQKLAKELKISTTTDNKKVVQGSDIVFLCVKPQMMDSVLEEIKGIVNKNQIIISIAAGIKLSKLEKLNCKIVRVMPNTPCLVGEMAAGYTINPKISSSDKKLVQELLDNAGIAIEVKEHLLDSITGLSGSGPAFIARIIEGFIEAGVEDGLDEKTAKKLALKTFIGTAKLLENMNTSDLITMVTSSNGTTEAGRKILDNSNIKDIIKQTIKRAKERSEELGKSN